MQLHGAECGMFVDIAINTVFLFVLQIHLRAGDIPSSVESIAISGAGEVVIQDSAIYELPHLRSFTIDNSGTLHVQAHGFKVNDARLQSLRITAIQLVSIVGFAFQGRWENTSTITIKNINNFILVGE